MKIVLIISLVTVACEFAMATAAPGNKGNEVNCQINISIAKDSKNKSKPSLDMRVVSLPVLKLSGKKVTLDNTGMTSQCRNNYGAEVAGKLIVSACSDSGDPSDITEVYFEYYKAPEITENKDSISEGGGSRKFFCNLKKTGVTDSKKSNNTAQ